MATSNFRYESPESTALGNITPTSYDYRDQSKLLSKLTGDVSYMAAYLRKMQKGIDDANQNIAQQIGEMLREAVTIIGGHGDTGFDFGDLKYVLKMFGSFFNLGTDSDGNLPLPLNLFDAAWHFFTQYIVNGAHWKELLDETVDNVIAELLSLFGNVPILGEALEQLAAFLSNLRDVLEAVSSGLHAIFDALGIDIDNLPGWIDYWENLFAPLFNMLHNIFGGITDDGIIGAIKDFLTSLDAPFAASIHDAVTWIRTWVSQFSITGGDLAQDIKDYLDNVGDFLNQFTITRALSYGLMGFKDTGNMLRNPTLDKDASNWDIDNMGSGASFNPTWNSTVGNTAIGSIEMSGTGTTWADSEAIVVVPNQKVVLSAHYSKTTTAPTDITIQAVELDVNKTFIRVAGTTTVHLSTSSPTWSQINNDSAYRVSHDTFYVMLRVKSVQTSGGDIFWDDFSYIKDGSIHSFSMPDFGALIDNIIQTLTGSLTFGHSLTEVPSALQAIPVNFISGLLSGGGKIVSTLIGNLDASIITTGTLAAALYQNLVDAISQGFGGTTGLGISSLQSFLAGLPSAQNIVDAVSQGFGGITGLTLTGLKTFLSGLPNAQAVIDKICNALLVTGTGHTLTDLFNALSAFPARLLTGFMPLGVTIIGNTIGTLFNSGGLIGTFLNSIDASKITTGALATGLTISGNALSTLFNSSGVLASALTGAIATGVTIVGNAISSLFDGTGLIGSFLNSIDASKITTGALTTSLTISGIALSSMFSGSGVLASALTGAIATAVTIAGNAVSSLFNGTGLIGTFLNSIDASKVTTGTLGTSRIPALAASAITSGTFGQTLIPSLTSGWTGTLHGSRLTGAGTIPGDLVDTGSNTAFVATTVTSTSASYAAGGAGDSVTVTIGPSLMALVTISCELNNGSAGQGARVSWSASGANTIASNDDHSLMVNNGSTTLGEAISSSWSSIVSFSSTGSTTFDMEYKRTGSVGTASFANRRISVLPL